MSPPEKNFAPEKIAPPAPRFHHRESHVAGRLGISRDYIRELRGKLLKEGEHWAHQHRRVELSDEAVQLLAQACNSSLAPGDLAETPAPPRPFHAGPSSVKRLLIGPPGNPGLVQLEVKLKAWESPVNRAILLAYLPGTDPRNRQNHVRVRVQSNANFVKHMEFKARLLSPPDFYELIGPCPRDRGRW